MGVLRRLGVRSRVGVKFLFHVNYRNFYVSIFLLTMASPKKSKISYVNKPFEDSQLSVTSVPLVTSVDTISQFTSVNPFQFKDPRLSWTQPTVFCFSPNSPLSSQGEGLFPGSCSGRNFPQPVIRDPHGVSLRWDEEQLPV